MRHTEIVTTNRYHVITIQDREDLPELFRAMAEHLEALADANDLHRVHGVEYYEHTDEYASEWSLSLKLYEAASGA